MFLYFHMFGFLWFHVDYSIFILISRLVKPSPVIILGRGSWHCHRKTQRKERKKWRQLAAKRNRKGGQRFIMKERRKRSLRSQTMYQYWWSMIIARCEARHLNESSKLSLNMIKRFKWTAFKSSVYFWILFPFLVIILHNNFFSLVLFLEF